MLLVHLLSQQYIVFIYFKMADIHICWSFRCCLWYFLLCWLYSKTHLWMIPWQFYSWFLRRITRVEVVRVCCKWSGRVYVIYPSFPDHPPPPSLSCPSADRCCYLGHRRHCNDDLRRWFPQPLGHWYYFCCGLCLDVSALQGMTFHLTTLLHP